MSSGFLIVNANWAGKMLYNVIYPFIPVTARANLSVTSPADTSNYLLERIDASELPIEFGGTGGSILESYDNLKLN